MGTQQEALQEDCENPYLPTILQRADLIFLVCSFQVLQTPIPPVELRAAGDDAPWGC